VAILEAEPEPSEEPRLVTDLYVLAETLGLTGDISGAIMACQKALDLDEQKFGMYHPKLAGGLIQLGRFQRALREWREARLSFERALSILAATLPYNHPDVQSLRAEMKND
jgi:hypothetical protein